MQLGNDQQMLLLCPLLSSYSARLGVDVTTTQFASGMPRQRVNGVGKPHTLEVTFRHKAVHQQYLLSFWRLFNAKSFGVRLILEATELQWYEARFIGEPSLTVIGNGIFEFAIGLVARPKPLDLLVDEAFIDAYIQSDGNLDGITALSQDLEILVNEALPDAVRSF